MIKLNIQKWRGTNFNEQQTPNQLLPCEVAEDLVLNLKHFGMRGLLFVTENKKQICLP